MTIDEFLQRIARRYSKWPVDVTIQIGDIDVFIGMETDGSWSCEFVTAYDQFHRGDGVGPTIEAVLKDMLNGD